MSRRQFAIALAAIAAAWLAVRVLYFNGYYTEDAPGYVADAIWAATGQFHARDYVNGLNVGTFLPVALPVRVLGKSEIALALWPLACSLLGLFAMVGAARVFFGRAGALLAGVQYATYPGDVFFSTVVMPDAIQAGWLTWAMYSVARSYEEREGRWRAAAAGAAIGACHLIRANDVQLLPIGLLATLAIAAFRRRGWRVAISHAAAYVLGWLCVIGAEGCVYALATGDFLLRAHVVMRHYGSPDSIVRAGLNVDPRTIPFSLLAPLTWWLHGGWGSFNQDQAYHGLLFTWAAGLFAVAVLLALAVRQPDERLRAGLVVGAIWLFWPLLYHQFGSQSLTRFVPMHRLSRHLVVDAPGAMFTVTAGVSMIANAIRQAGLRWVKPAAWSLGAAAMTLHLHLNLDAERVAYAAFHRIKDTYIRVSSRLPAATGAVIADPGDLCFLDFRINPIGVDRVKMIPFAAVERCDAMPPGVVLTQSNPGWAGAAPVIVETVRRLPCLTRPPATWHLLYEGYPEKVYVTDESGRAGR